MGFKDFQKENQAETLKLLVKLKQKEINIVDQDFLQSLKESLIASQHTLLESEITGIVRELNFLGLKDAEDIVHILMKKY